MNSSEGTLTTLKPYPVRKKPYGIVIGLDDGTTGIQTARILARRQVPVIALAKNEKHFCCRTNSCHQIVTVDTDCERLIEQLERMGPLFSERPVLFPCQDQNTLLVSRHRERLQKWYRVVLPPINVVETMMDKISFYKFAQEQGLPIPTTRFLDSRTSAEAAGEYLRFPCILKPTSRSAEWMRSTHAKAFLVASQEELLQRFDQCRGWTDGLIAQDWIRGPDTEHYSCNCYFDSDSQPVVTFTTRKLRQWPPRTGQGCLGEACRNDEVQNATVRTFRTVPFRGLAYLEMKRDVCTGEYSIIEPNIGRPTGRSATAEGGGVELIYTMYCDAMGWELPASRQQTSTGVKWIHWRRDVQAAFTEWRRGELTLREWFRSLRGRKTCAIFSWRDPVPFVMDIVRVIRLSWSAAERGKRDYHTQRSEPRPESVSAKSV